MQVAQPPRPPRTHIPTGLVLLSLTDGSEQGSASVGTDPVAVIVSDDGKTGIRRRQRPGRRLCGATPRSTGCLDAARRRSAFWTAASRRAVFRELARRRLGRGARTFEREQTRHSSSASRSACDDDQSGRPRGRGEYARTVKRHRWRPAGRRQWIRTWPLPAGGCGPPTTKAGRRWSRVRVEDSFTPSALGSKADQRPFA
jgi:hypothetical protein